MGVWFKGRSLKLDMVAHAGFQHWGGRGRQTICEFEASLACLMSSRIARTTQRNPVKDAVHKVRSDMAAGVDSCCDSGVCTDLSSASKERHGVKARL